ncbi:dUTP diphosphatase [Neomegalonema perideroedes]|uniref:dUTP diphosphatase n=1 Tax=Neomegalonema perideroedes TaxID=217219 RepID=UPI0003AA8C80|nr:dUTP diphosphatase [Neomegalonema perideroedes]
MTAPLEGPVVRVKRLPHGVGLPAPFYASAGAAGADVCAALPEGAALTLVTGARSLVPTGFAFAVPPGWEMQIRPRSGLALKQGVTVLNAPGTLDSDYRGELFVLLINLDNSPATLRRGDRIAQLVIAPAPQARFEEVADLDATARGEGGFGSTGISFKL